MGFTSLSEYGEGSLPVCGIAMPYHYCSTTSDYKPFDVSGASGALGSLFETAKNTVLEDRLRISKYVNTLADEWGTKFAAIDGKDLGIVDAKGFENEGLTVATEVDAEKENCDSFVNDIISKTEEINQYLQQLDATYQEYLDYKSQYNGLVKDYNGLVAQHQAEAAKTNPNEELLSSLNSQIASLDAEMTSLQRLLDRYVDDGQPEGSWVLG